LRHKPSIDELKKIFVGRVLVPKLHGILTEAHDRELAVFDLTTRQASILASCEIGEANTQAQLADIYSLEASSINRLVDRLVRKGFLLRKRSKADRRQVFLEITPAGKKCLWDAIPVASSIAERAWRGVTDGEKATLESIVNKVAANLNVTSVPRKHHIEKEKEFS
jgi:DNA-binding MarR family transcriptional regulator